MKLPIGTIIKLLVDEAYSTYIDIKAAQSDDSEAGKKITRNEIWNIVTGLILRIGPKLEEVLGNSNAVNYSFRYRWLVLSIIVKSLEELPEDFEQAKHDDNKIDKEEAFKIIGQVLKNSIPKILDITENHIE